DGYGAPTARVVRLAELHSDAAHAAHAAVAVVEDRDGSGQPVELDALLLGVMDLLGAGGAFGPRAAVDAVDVFGAEPERDAHRVHRRVARADDRHAPAARQR